MNKKIIFGVTVIIIVIIVILLSNKTPSANTIKLGAVLPFTGSSGITGESSKNGLDLAVSEINNNGGINGSKVSIDYEDSQTKTDIGLSGFKKLVDSDHIPVVFTSVSGVALAIAPVANSSKIVQMDIVSGTPAYSTPNDFTFRTGISSLYFGNQMSDILMRRNVKAVALLYVNTDYGVGYLNIFKQKYESAGGKIIATESYNQDSTDFRTQIEKLKAVKPVALVLVSLQKETPSLLKQMDQLGLNVPIYTDVYAAELSGNFGTNASQNMVYLKPTFDSINPNNDIATNFVKDYVTKYGKQPDFIAAQAYDGMNLIATAMKSCKSPSDTKCVKNSLYQIKNWNGAIGTNISFDVNGDITGRSLDIMGIKDNSYIKLSD